MPPFDHFYSQVRPADFLDVVVVAGLLYVALSWLRRRTSVAVAVGFALVGVLYGLARALDMYLTLLLFHGGLTIILIGLVIVFQKDLRRAFERLASWRPRSFRVPAPDGSRTVDTLTEALAVLADQRIGALVVVPGREPLEGHLRGGVPLGGALSLPLLHSLFHPASQGHDGAVLIEADRISHFGVHLPLTGRVAALGPGGTRHAAALGLAEVSDALVLVVSEERGTVSVAEEDRLDVMPSAAALKDRLTRFWEEHYPCAVEHSWLPWVTHNLPLKVLSGGVAVLLWLLLASPVNDVQRSFEAVPIEYRNLPEGWVIADTAPTQAKVTLHGPDRAFRALDPGELKVTLDMSQPREGWDEFPVTDDNLTLPAGLRVRPLDTPPLRVGVCRLTQAVLPVRPKLLGTFPEPYRVGEPRAEPATVRVLLRADDPGRPDGLETAPILLGGQTRTTTVEVALVVPPRVRLEQGQPAKVRVTIPVDRPDDAAPEKKSQ